ncbi:MAG: phosphatase PAP2 family protein [bacterium]
MPKWLKTNIFPLFIMLISLVGFLKLLTATEKITYYDAFILNKINDFTYPLLTSLVIFITKFGYEFIFLFFAILLMIFLKLKEYGKIYLISAVTIGGSLPVAIIKEFINRTRPIIENPVYQAEGFSFPSGHATGAMCFYGILIYLVFTNIKKIWLKIILILLLILIILAVGASRIYLGVHYPSDVFAGYFLGLFWINLGIVNYKYLFNNG